ncbi:hypothetical protein BJF91_10760 [Allorhizobium taibaishanense]|uniref:Metal-dependent amidase/aminoacylase/carboxypeptidase family protein n=1 Tax=Allorhizobium taibaishanense TaxID=887144 RepID=A0A1Q8ZYH3_9HYPH|nr:metal-dependent amidase/aminoacylase/carboxypeptidase family protein [Allorhizobium taibaishanense]OLP47163.1 hypothetical protein BJF91_10760 [Allorhizobium taibaishanense]
MTRDERLEHIWSIISGRPALDAVELMNVGINLLRVDMTRDCRFHYATTDAGGRAANVVQAKAEWLYLIRVPGMLKALALTERVDQLARGAAIARAIYSRP